MNSIMNLFVDCGPHYEKKVIMKFLKLHGTAATGLDVLHSDINT